MGLDKVTSRDPFQLHSIALLLMDKYLWFCFPDFSSFLFWHCIFPNAVCYPSASLWPNIYTVALLFSMKEWLAWRGWGVVFSLKLWSAKRKELFSKPKSNAKCFSFPSICSSIWVEKAVFMVTVSEASPLKRNGVSLLFLERRHEHCSQAVM